MPKELAEPGLAAVLESLPGAGAQGVHCDSLKPGATGITSYEQDQYVYILFFAFHAMRILQELGKDRLAATEHIRSRLAATGVFFSDKEWTDVAEEGIWQFLVHEQFRVRRVRPFEVVRVPVCKNHTIALDTRCPHAGAPWSGVRRAYRGHFYGYERALRKLAPDEMTDKDEYLTVDLCDNDHFPIIGWAQESKIFKRARP
jgi:hypothetical protein